MDFWNTRKAQDEESDERGDTPKPTFLQNLTEFVKDEAKDEAISSVVEYLSGGWLTYESDDDDDEEPQRKQQAEGGTFEERLQRRLAELQEQAAAPAEVPAAPAPSVDAPVAPLQRPAPRPAQHRPGGFGRKGL